MMNFKKAGLVATSAALLSAAAIAAPVVTNDIVIDKNGNQVVSTNGNCVITKWDSAFDVCGFSITKEMRTVYFDFNKSTLTAKEKAELDQVASILKGASHVESVDIVGFADMIGDSGYNKRLSTKRANTVKAYLSKKGLKTRNVRVEGMGEEEGAQCKEITDRKEQIACLAEDRRVEIQLNLKK
jgi:outer membrane protein OmpA-like peptidoglycan-associated protein